MCKLKNSKEGHIFKENLEKFIFFTKTIYKCGQTESSFLAKKILNKVSSIMLVLIAQTF